MENDKKEPQPWEEEFPIDHANAEHVTRREFAKALVFLSAGMCVGNAWIIFKDKLFPPHELASDHRICAVSDLPVGGMLAFTLPHINIPYILIRPEENTWRAFEQKCTHLSCAVYYDAAIGKIACPCHKGFFDAKTGAVLQGPPPRPLPQIAVEQRDGAIFALSNRYSTT